MKTYELNYLLPIDLDNAKVQEIALKLESLAQEKGGILIGERKTKRVELGYEIKENKKAIQSFFGFKIEQSELEALKKELKNVPEILRYIILDKKKVKALKTYKVKKDKKIKAKKDILKISEQEMEAKIDDAIQSKGEIEDEIKDDDKEETKNKEKAKEKILDIESADLKPKDKSDNTPKPEKKKKVGLKRIEEKLNEILNI